MGYVAAVVFVIVLLAIWGRGPRKSVAQTIILGEDVSHKARTVLAATPAVAATIKAKAAKATVTGVTTSSAVAKVGFNKGSAVGDVLIAKGAEALDESKHYLKGFVHDVGRERQRILTDRKKAARAARMSAATPVEPLALPEKSVVR